MKKQLDGWIAAITLLILSGAGMCLAAGGRPENDRIGQLEIPFKLYRDYMIVAKGLIGGLDELNFLIDTGAVPSVVSTRIVKKLNLEGNTEQLSVFTHDVKARSLEIPDLVFGPIHLKSLPVLVHDLNFIQRQTSMRIDAIIGLDVLGWSNMAIDYKARRIIFGARLPEEPNIPLELGPGCMLVPVQVGERRLRLMVDTGARDLMLFEWRFKRHFPNLRPSGRRQSANMGGVADLKQVRLPDLSIGDQDLGRQWATLIPSEADSTPDFDGLLGLSSLEVQRVVFDFSRQLMSWVR